MPKTITFHNTPKFYVAYMENWLAHKKKENAPAVELAIVEDLKQLVEIAIEQLKPVPADPEKK